MSEKSKYSLLKERRIKDISLPGNILAYFSLCKEIRTNRSELPVYSKLPFFSKITKEHTPEGVIKAYWSFLKY
ncbi:MAG: hypothetical protein HYY52_01370 [Candidatus Melainabacteria bacterium]|nr:hypothetical protein [Candidatus Melainabacteria bacterium]